MCHLAGPFPSGPAKTLCLFKDNARRSGANRGAFDIHTVDHRCRNFLVYCGMGTIRHGDGDGCSAIRMAANVHMQGNLSKKRHTHAAGFVTGAAMTEYIGAFTAFGTDEGRHVFNDAENRHVHLAEHVQAFARIYQGDILRRGDNDRPGQRHLLRHGQLCIAGARRHIDNQ